MSKTKKVIIVLISSVSIIILAAVLVIALFANPIRKAISEKFKGEKVVLNEQETDYVKSIEELADSVATLSSCIADMKEDYIGVYEESYWGRYSRVEWLDEEDRKISWYQFRNSEDGDIKQLNSYDAVKQAYEEFADVPYINSISWDINDSSDKLQKLHKKILATDGCIENLYITATIPGYSVDYTTWNDSMDKWESMTSELLDGVNELLEEIQQE